MNIQELVAKLRKEWIVPKDLKTDMDVAVWWYKEIHRRLEDNDPTTMEVLSTAIGLCNDAIAEMASIPFVFDPDQMDELRHAGIQVGW